MTYAFPAGGMPPQTDDPSKAGAIFTTAYAFIPAGVMRDIVTSELPGWTGARTWILARPLSGFAETFAQYAVEVLPGGGSDGPEPDSGVEAGIFVASGELTLTVDDSRAPSVPVAMHTSPRNTRGQCGTTTRRPCSSTGCASSTSRQWDSPRLIQS